MTKEKTLTKQEGVYFKQVMRGENPGIAGFNALLKAINEGRRNLDLSDPELKYWSEAMAHEHSCIIISNLLNKINRKEKLTKRQFKIIKDYEEKGLLPKVD